MKTPTQIIEEIQQAILQNQKEYHGILLPSPQGSGTLTQKRSFAKMKAEKIYKEFFSN